MVELSIALNQVLSIFGTRETDSINSQPIRGLDGTFPTCTSSTYFEICDRAINGVSSSERGKRLSCDREVWFRKGHLNNQDINFIIEWIGDTYMYVYGVVTL